MGAERGTSMLFLDRSSNVRCSNCAVIDGMMSNLFRCSCSCRSPLVKTSRVISSNSNSDKFLSARSAVPDGVSCHFGWASSVTPFSKSSSASGGSSVAGSRDARSRFISSVPIVRNLRSRNGFAATVRWFRFSIKAIFSSS